MSDELEHYPIPPRLWARMIEFMQTGRTGQLTLHVDAGVPNTLEVREWVRSRKAPGAPGRAECTT